MSLQNQGKSGFTFKSRRGKYRNIKNIALAFGGFD